MNEITFYAPRHPRATLIMESQGAQNKHCVACCFQDYLSLTCLFILIGSGHFRSFLKDLAKPIRALVDDLNWIIERLPVKGKRGSTFNHCLPRVHINPDINHQSNINDMDFKTFRVRPLTFSDLARLYHLSRPTVRKRAKRIGIEKRKGNFLDSEQINLFIKHNGWPRSHEKRKPKDPPLT